MPSRRLHAARTRLLLGEDYTDVQQLLDRTAHTHGPSHRADVEHSIPDLMKQLVLQGKLTPQRIAAGMLHQADDRMWTDLWSRIPIRGPPRRLLKTFAEEMYATYLEGEYRRLHGR